MNSAQDHGYSQPPYDFSPRAGDIFRQKCALGIYESRVLRRHPDGYFETVVVCWITPVPEFRQGFVGTLEILSRDEITAAKMAD